MAACTSSLSISRPAVARRAAPLRARAAPRRAAARSATSVGDLVDNMKKKFDASDNQPVVAGYGAAALAFLVVVDKVVNLPVLNLVLPKFLEVAGVVTVALLAFRYVKEGEDAEADIDAALEKINSVGLPGLKK